MKEKDSFPVSVEEFFPRNKSRESSTNGGCLIKGGRTIDCNLRRTENAVQVKLTSANAVKNYWRPWTELLDRLRLFAVKQKKRQRKHLLVNQGWYKLINPSNMPEADEVNTSGVLRGFLGEVFSWTLPRTFISARFKVSSVRGDNVHEIFVFY